MDWNKIFEILLSIAPWITGGLAGATLTIFVNSRIRNKNRRIITFNSDYQKFRLDFNGSEENKFESELKVSYKEHNYENLVLYRANFSNIGFKSIDKSKIIFLFPKESRIVEEVVNTSPIEIKYKKEINETKEKREYHINFENIEVGDNFSNLFLIDCDEPEKIKMLVRDAEDAIIKESQPNSLNDFESDIQQFLLFIALFISFGSIPFLGKMFQAAAFVVMIPTIIKLFRFFAKRKNINSVEINTLNMKESRLRINQN